MHPLSRISIASLLLFGCTATSTLQTPDILPVGFSQVTVETGAGLSEGVTYGESMWPYGVSFRSALQEEVEVGIKFGSPGGLLADVKRRVLQSERATVAFGVVGGAVGLDVPVATFALPLYVGWSVGPDTMIYGALRPAIMGEEQHYFSDRERLIYGGGAVSLGVRVGSVRQGFYFEMSYGETFGREFAPNDVTDARNLYVAIAPFYAMRPFTPPRDPWTDR